MKARPLKIVCHFGCGHEIVGTFATPDLIELMNEHHRIVHADEIARLMR